MIDRLTEKPLGPFPHSQAHEAPPRPSWLRPKLTTTSPSGPSDLGDFVRPVEELILKYPAAALASAFLVGVAFAWWIKRK
jgi:hypothetical protein